MCTWVHIHKCIHKGECTYVHVPSQYSHVGPIWAPLGLATGPYLGCPTRARLDLSVGSTWAPHGLAQDGPRIGTGWANSRVLTGR